MGCRVFGGCGDGEIIDYGNKQYLQRLIRGNNSIVK